MSRSRSGSTIATPPAEMKTYRRLESLAGLPQGEIIEEFLYL